MAPIAKLDRRPWVAFTPLRGFDYPLSNCVADKRRKIAVRSRRCASDTTQKMTPSGYVRLTHGSYLINLIEQRRLRSKLSSEMRFRRYYRRQIIYAEHLWMRAAMRPTRAFRPIDKPSCCF